MKVGIILLAAGASSRMRGRDKLLEDIEGETLLHRTARIASAAGVDQTIVVIPKDHAARKNAVYDLNVEVVEASNWADGMASSLAAGVAKLSDCDAAIVSLADMPDITSDDYNLLISKYSPANSHEICRATTVDGIPGHPVLFGNRFFGDLLRLKGDHGAREIIQANKNLVLNVPTSGTGAISDLDTPEDWEKWRK